MTTTRRTVLLQGGAIGAGLIAANMSAVRALAAPKTPPVRRSLQGLAWNDPIVATYRDAVGIMKQKATSDKFNWVQLANFHGSINTGFRYCPHGDWYFLPWHRAFTAMYERIVRHLTKNDDFAMPYWDWTANPTMPEVFLPEKTPDGKTNWLCVNEDGKKRTWPATKPMPANIVGPSVLKTILNASPYEIFGTSRPAGQNSLDPHWITGGGGVQGTLEASPHNQVHNNIGGWMPTAASPRDPIFFMHHGNIDRIWALWNLKHANSTDPLWMNMPFKENFLNPDGSFWSPKVSDLYVPEKLGYSYGFKAPTAAIASAARTMTLERSLNTILAAPTAATINTDKVATAVVENTKSATPDAALALKIAVPQAALQGVVRSVPVGSGFETMDFSAAREASTRGSQALAILRNVAITDPSTTTIHIYLGDEPVPADASTSDPRYVGSFAVLDHGEGGHGAHEGHELPSFVLDLTDALQRVYGSAGTIPSAIGLQVVVGNETGNGKAGSATPQRVEVVIVSG